VNEVFADAVDQACAIIAASRVRRPVQQARHADLIAELLGDA
jgi:hypothetical protein